MSARLALALVLALTFAAPALASERHPTASELEHEVMCPTCKTLLELSHAPVAERMRAFIRARIADGETKSTIKTQLIGEFGEGVLAAPPTRGFGLVAWVLPILGLLGAGAVVGLVALRWTRVVPLEAPSGLASSNGRVRLDPKLERMLDDELARHDG
jgi:cytochrome c-type biogenesis protein CcmH